MNVPLMLRMTVPTVVISVLLLAVGVGSAWNVHVMQQNVSEALLVNVSSMRSAEELEIVVREVRTQLHHYLLTRNRSYLDMIHPLRPEVDRWLGEAIRWVTTEHEQVLMDRVKRGLTQFYDDLDDIEGITAEGSLERLQAITDGLLVHEVLDPVHDYLDFNEKELEKSSTQNRSLAGRLIFVLLLLGITGSAAGLVTGLGLARAVNRSLVQLSVPLRAAAGQLDEVVGPITFAAPWDLNDLEGVLHQIAHCVGTMVERLRQSEREVLRTEQLAAVGQMAAGMAHEVRNPLTAMKILVQASLAREGAALGGRDLVVLEEEITRLERVIQTFLHFARPPELEKRTVELGPLVEDTLNLVASRAVLCDVEVGCDLPDQPVWGAVDPGQVRQVLLNLLLNALDAAPPGGEVHVELEALEQDELEEGTILLRVRDTGCGLPGELGPRIFAPFVSTKETGLGLGLSICKRIVEAHGGTLAAEDGPQGGAVFTVALPA